MNRRDWMVTAGEAAAALGIAGLIDADSLKSPTLPAGLYLPSTDHLSHALYEATHAEPALPSAKPRFFSPAEFAVVERISGLILGEEADSFVAKEAAAWIDLRVFSSAPVREAAARLDPLHRALALAYYGGGQVDEFASQDDQGICREGLAWLETQGDFLSLDTERQLGILDSISDARSHKGVENAGTRFFAFIKAETIRGFYTSRTGLKELDYKGNGFYASSPGCKNQV